MKWQNLVLRQRNKIFSSDPETYNLKNFNSTQSIIKLVL